MTNQIAKLLPGEEVKLKFHGSKSLGNEPYELDLIFKRVTGAGEDQRAVFDYGDGTEFEVYRFNGRWCYGSSAERLSILR